MKRITVLERYTATYRQGESLVTPEQQLRLDYLLNEIHKCMDEADDIVSDALLMRKASSLGVNDKDTDVS